MGPLVNNEVERNIVYFTMCPQDQKGWARQYCSTIYIRFPKVHRVVRLEATLMMQAVVQLLEPRIDQLPLKSLVIKAVSKRWVKAVP